MVVDLDAVRQAAARIAGEVHRTPVLTSAFFDARLGFQVRFKAECFQKVGAFKIRGATNLVRSLSGEEADRGVLTHSSGNHAQAVALAARRRGIPAWIVMPDDAPRVKRAATRGYGATVIPCGSTAAEREAKARAALAETGAVFVHPYDDDRIIAGQGTAALELLEDAGPLDAIVAPIGGGGLISGTAVAARGLDPSLRVFGAEPAGADDAKRSLAAGRRIPLERADTIADGLRTSLADRTFALIRDHVEAVETVSDAQAIEAMRNVWERMKVVIEPSAAVAVAALDALRDRLGGLRVGVILSGGNVAFPLAGHAG